MFHRMYYQNVSPEYLTIAWLFLIILVNLNEKQTNLFYNYIIRSSLISNYDQARHLLPLQSDKRSCRGLPFGYGLTKPAIIDHLTELLSQSEHFLQACKTTNLALLQKKYVNVITMSRCKNIMFFQFLLIHIFLYI